MKFPSSGPNGRHQPNQRFQSDNCTCKQRTTHWQGRVLGTCSHMSISGAHLVQHVIYDLTVLVLWTEQDDLGIFADFYRVSGRPVE